MSDEAKDAKAAKKRAQELLANDVSERTRRFALRGNVSLGIGVALIVAALFVRSGPFTPFVALLGVFFALLGVRVRRALRTIAGIRAATESNAKSDHGELEKRLRAELDRAPHFTLRLSIVELLAISLWKRGAIAELDELLRPYASASNFGDRGAYGESFAHAHSFALLARACTSNDSIEEAARRIEEGGALDSRTMTRLALARAISAARRGDSPSVLRALEGFEDRSTEAGAHDRALGRALRAMARRAPTGASYRETSSTATGGAIGAWCSKVYAPAAPFVEEQALREIDEPEWARKPTETPSLQLATITGKRPVVKLQRELMIVALVSLVCAGALLMEPTAMLSLAFMVAALLASIVALGLRVKRVRDARRDLLALRLSTRWKHEGNAGLAVKKLQTVTDSRDSLASASAYVHLADIVAHSGDPKTAISLLDSALGRLAWLPEKGRESLPWANVALVRPRYFAMAGMEREAEAALAFALMSVIEVSAGRGMLFSTRFWLALTAGRREEAIELARTFDVRSPIDARTELARDAVLAIGDPSSQQRVRARIEAWPSARALFERLCPWIAEGWSAPAATGVRVEASDEPPQSNRGESHSVSEAADGESRGDGHGRGGSTP